VLAVSGPSKPNDSTQFNNLRVIFSAVVDECETEGAARDYTFVQCLCGFQPPSTWAIPRGLAVLIVSSCDQPDT